jgi:hypothetical protein
MLPDRGSAIAQGYAFLAHQDRQFSEARVDLDQCNFLFICGGSAEIGCEQLQQATTYSITPLGNVRFGSKADIAVGPDDLYPQKRTLVERVRTTAPIQPRRKIGLGAPERGGVTAHSGA